MGEKKGIEELKAVLAFTNDAAVKAIAALKDGAQFSDLRVLMDPALALEAKAAYQGLAGLDDELKDLDLEEAEALVALCMANVKAIVAAVKA